MSVLALETDKTLEREARRPPSMVERMTLILDAFEGPSTRLSLEQVASITHLPRSTAHRILDQLIGLEWLTHSAFGYALGNRSLSLGGSTGIHEDVRAAASPVLHQLQLRTGLVVHLAVREGSEVRYLDKLGGRFVTAVPSRVGGTASAHRTALGKAMLAWTDAEVVDREIGPSVERTAGGLEGLHHEMHRIRARKGLAFERGEYAPEIACVAAAVRGPDGPVAAISLVGEVSAPLEKAAPLVIEGARLVSRTLFPGIAPDRP
ncbi:MAG: IclR family transcriptional regulator [Nocardioides sp.]